MKTKIMIVDDHSLVIEGLQRVFARENDMMVVSKARNGNEAVRICKKERPDIIIMDIKMQGMDGVEATRIIKQECPQIKVIALSGFSDRVTVCAMLRQGIGGFVLKNGPAQEIIDAVRAIMDGRCYLSPHILRIITEETDSGGKSCSWMDKFTDREREVALLLKQGCDTKKIMDKLGLTATTVNAHRRSIMEKLDVDNPCALMLVLLGEKSG